MQFAIIATIFAGAIKFGNCLLIRRIVSLINKLNFSIFELQKCQDDVFRLICTLEPADKKQEK